MYPVNHICTCYTTLCNTPKRCVTSGFNEARDKWGGSDISWTICKSSAPRSTEIIMPAPHHSNFYRLDTLSVTQPTVSKHRRQLLLLFALFIIIIENVIGAWYTHTVSDMICRNLWPKKDNPKTENSTFWQATANKCRLRAMFEFQCRENFHTIHIMFTAGNQLIKHLHWEQWLSQLTEVQLQDSGNWVYITSFSLAQQCLLSYY